MTSHTHGPWTFYADSVPVDHKTYKSPGYYDNLHLQGPNGEFIAGCDEYYVFSHNAANRSLISAAPELLDALKALRDHAFTMANSTGIPVPSELVAIFESAIAKAEGR